MAVAHGRNLDLARLELFSLGDLETEDAVLEGGSRLVRLESAWKGHGPAEAAPANLLEDVAALLRGTLIGGLAGDGHGVVLDGDVHVVGANAGERGLDGTRIRVGRDVQGQRRAGIGPGEPLEGAEIVVEEAVHRRAHGQHVPDRRGTAHDRHGSYTSW